MRTIGRLPSVRCWRLLAALRLVALLAVFYSSCVCAMNFELEGIPGWNDAYILLMSGPITLGDLDRLADYIKAQPQNSIFVAFVLNSEGGNVSEAESLAEAIRDISLHQLAHVVVPDGAVCASACFLLFAAGTSRIAGPTALIGVHSVSVRGDETPGALGLTTLLARDAAAYGVPPGIIGKTGDHTSGKDNLAEPR